MPFESRNKSFYFEVTKNTLILVQICVLPDSQNSKRSEQYNWFTNLYLVKLLEKLKDIALARVLSAGTNEEPKNIKEFIQGFHMLYTFKKKKGKQYVVTQTSVGNNKQKSSSGVAHKELQLFSENLIAYVSLQPIHIGVAQPLPLLTAEMVKARKEKSKYFRKHDDTKLTLSAVKKQTNLQSIVSKMKNSATQESSTPITDGCQGFSKHSNDCVSSSSTEVNQQINKKDILAGKTSNVSNKPDDKPHIVPRCTGRLKMESCTAANNILSHKSVPCLSENNDKQSIAADTSSLSRKRLRNNTTGSDSYETENDNEVVVKRVLSRKKRPKYTHKDDNKNSHKQECALTGMVSVQSHNHIDSDFSMQDAHKEFSAEMHCMKSTNITEEMKSTLQTLDDYDKNCTNTEILTNSKNSVYSLSTDDGYSTISELSKTSSSKTSDFGEETREAVVIVDEKERETITIRDVIPSFDNVKEVADLTDDHISYLIQKLQKRLKNIFKGKEYCRRHEDYKKGGKSKGDLVFQVRFGLYSEDQHHTIMSELISIFCARHNKYIDYLSKVLLPETFILIYIEVFGGNHDDVERLLMGQGNKQVDITFTDGSSTE